MFDIERRQKLASSPIVLFLYFSLIASIVLQIPNMGNGQPFSWKLVVTHGIPSGLMMAIITFIRIRSVDKKTGLTWMQQNQMNAAVWRGELPSDPVIKNALPDYLRKRYKQAKSSRKFALPILLVMAILHIAFLAAGKSTHQTIFALVFVAIVAWSYRSTQRTIENIEYLSAQLGIDPASEPEATVVEPEDFDGDAKARLLWIVAAMVIIVPVFLSTNMSGQQAPTSPIEDTSSSQQQEPQPAEDQPTEEEAVDYPSDAPSTDITITTGTGTDQAPGTEIDLPNGRVPLPEDYANQYSSDEPVATSDSIIIVN
jgi:hypothetical protein